MSAFDWAAAIGGGLLLWTALALAVGFPLGRAMRRADEAVQLDDTRLVPVATYPPPVPLPAAWGDFDEVMFRWFAEGAR